MPQQQLTQPVSFTATVSATFNAGNGTAAVQGAMSIPVGSPTVTTFFVPVNENWFITGFYLQAGVSVSIANARVQTTVNFTPQRLQPAEAEIQQNIYNKLKLTPDQWIAIPGGNQFTQSLIPNVSIVTTTTSVTIYETIRAVPLKLLP
jgi:hypothetical protein